MDPITPATSGNDASPQGVAAHASGRVPLHVQILIALVLGTIAGVLINPGSTVLPDVSFDRVQLTVTRAEDGDAWRANVSTEGLMPPDSDASMETTRRRFQSIEALTAAFSVLDARRDLATLEPGNPIHVVSPLRVSDRTIEILESGGQATVTYHRRHNGRFVTSSRSVSRATAKIDGDPWENMYRRYGGTWRHWMTGAAKFCGDLFLRMLKMITVPLILTSLISGISSLGSSGQFGAMFSRTLIYYALTSMLAIATGLAIVNIIQPGIGAQLPGGTEAVVGGEGSSLSGILLGLVENMIPANPVAAVAGSDFLAIIAFSIVFGVFMIRTGGRPAEILREFFTAAFEVTMRMTMAIISLAPFGVFCFMVYATASQGLAIFETLAWYMLTVFIGLVIHGTVTLPLLVKFIARRSPLEFARAMSPALMTAFSTASSNGTLPLTLSCVEERAGVSNRVSSFVLPLGATVNMDGTALYEAVAVLFIAQAFRGDITLAEQVVVAITALLASVGAAGIPHAGLVMMAIVLQAVNLPLEAQGVIIAVDRVLDMCRTSINVWSDACGCAVIQYMLGDKVTAEPESH